MKRAKHVAGIVAIACVVVTASCTVDTRGPTAPSTTPVHVEGYVEDDGCFLPIPGVACRPVADVRVELMNGPDKGRFALTASNGRFDLGTIQRPTCNVISCQGDLPYNQVNLSKPGWTTASHWIRDFDTVRIGQEPHVLHGVVSLPGDVPRPPAPGVRVEILDGPNAGKVTVTAGDGKYQFNDLVTSPSYQIESSKDGYLTARITREEGLTKNSVVAWVLTAK